MSSKTIHTCDLCHKEWERSRMHQVGIGKMAIKHDSYIPELVIDACLPCYAIYERAIGDMQVKLGKTK